MGGRTRGTGGSACWATVAAALAALACGGDVATEPGAGDGALPAADLRVLFVGNSLTYTNDLPGMVAALARAGGHSFAYGEVLRPGYSLEDHWNAGVARAIAEARADVVVLQQGPSSTPANQLHLRTWSERLAPAIREAGGRPALYMVWPSSDRAAFFPDVRAAYRDAAEAVDGLFVPAGDTWLRAWAREPELALWGSDGFHPSPTGTLAAAMTMYAVLFGEDASALPDPGGVPAATLALLRAAVGESLAAAGAPRAPAAFRGPGR